MLQIVDGVKVYVVDLKTMPKLPIAWTKPEEEPYARALQMAIEDGAITKPGKYGIHVHQYQNVVDVTYEVAQIIE